MIEHPVRILCVLSLALLLSGCEPVPRVRIAVTTSTQNSGILEQLLPPFEEQTGIQVDVIAVASGRALDLGRRGDVDLILVHARDREDEFLVQGYGRDRRDVMWNYFVIVGPPQDPAEIRGGRDAVAALEALDRGGFLFASRGDDSGTSLRERALRARTQSTPIPAAVIETGQGMGQTLQVASEKQAYTLTDRGTWLAFRDRIALEVLVEGDPNLRNNYGAILVDPERHPHVRHAEATQLLDYLVSDSARAVITSFRVAGQQLFHPASGTE